MVSQSHAFVSQLAHHGDRRIQPRRTLARHSGRADGRNNAAGHHARDWPRAGTTAQHDGVGVVPDRLPAEPNVYEHVWRQCDHHGLRPTELHRATWGRPQDQGLHPATWTLRRLRHQLGIPRDCHKECGRGEAHTQSVAHAAVRAVSLSLRVAGTGQWRPAQSDGGPW